MDSAKETIVTDLPVESEIDTHFSGIMNTLSQFKNQITVFSTQLKTLEKSVKKEARQHKRLAQKKQVRSSRKPSGFAEETTISTDLCEFLGKDHGTKIARTDVTRHICSYIKEKSLQNEENKRVIVPDTKLKSLLGVTDTDEITYFNLQRYMNKHFIK
tara:strand:+ start:4974 stop:5447 length:474 start_codon:yes stop_codon:yes gene_type:complete